MTKSTPSLGRKRHDWRLGCFGETRVTSRADLIYLRGFLCARKNCTDVLTIRSFIIVEVGPLDE
jgi:hypothetical protein